MKVLVTAGATWVKVDEVRILTNVFTGKTGLYLAKGLARKGHQVTLVANLHCLSAQRIAGIKIIDFRYFDEFKDAVCQQLKHNRYDVIIHSAAVSDYRMKQPLTGKAASGQKEFILHLVPTEKIIKQMRRLAPQAKIVQFKLEADEKVLIDKAYNSLCENKSDLVVANLVADVMSKYLAYIIDKKRTIIKVPSKTSLVNKLLAQISKA